MKSCRHCAGSDLRPYEAVEPPPRGQRPVITIGFLCRRCRFFLPSGQTKPLPGHGPRAGTGDRK